MRYAGTLTADPQKLPASRVSATTNGLPGGLGEAAVYHWLPSRRILLFVEAASMPPCFNLRPLPASAEAFLPHRSPAIASATW